LTLPKEEITALNKEEIKIEIPGEGDHMSSHSCLRSDSSLSHIDSNQI
jgi:hypothetical protein